MIKNILFDFGGVLITVKKTPVSIVEKQFGLAQGELMKKIKVNSIIPFVEGKLTIDGFKNSLISVTGNEIGNSLFELWNDRTLALLNDEMISLINDLNSRGYNCYLLSDTNEIHKNGNEENGRYDVFALKNRILSCEIGFSKISDGLNNTTKFFDYALDTLNVNADESIFIDDLQVNCEVANKVGIQTVLAKTPKQVVQDLGGILGLD